MTRQHTRNNTPDTILCVEDEPALLRDISEELSEAGYTPITARDGSQAIATLQDSPPDLVLCDIAMPGMNGYDLLRTVRARTELANVPFIFLTAYANPEEVTRGKRIGADDYLVKPIDYDLLLATIQAHLRQIKRICHANKNTKPRIHAAELVERFGLTPMETRVAKAITEGGSLQEIATDFGISRNTVAYHLRNIFGKTGTSRQAELVARLFHPEKDGSPNA